MKKASIIIPVYNCQEIIGRCLNNIIEQIDETYSIILVNDGSTDNTAKVCEKYCEKYNNVVLLNQRNAGPGAAREKGIKNSNSEYVFFIDADDYVEKGFFDTLLSTVESTDSDIAYCGYNIVDEEGIIIESKIYKYVEVKGEHGSLEYYLKQKNIDNFLWNKIFKRVLFDDVEFKYLYAGEDYCINVQVFSKANKIVSVSKALYNYVQTKNSLCRKDFSISRLDNIVAGEFVYDFIKNRFPELICYPSMHLASYAGQLYLAIHKSNENRKEYYMNILMNKFIKYFSFKSVRFGKISFKRIGFVLYFRAFVCKKR